MSEIQATRGPKMKPKLFRKSKIVLNGPHWVFFRKSSFCYKTWFGRIQGSRNQCKSMKSVRENRGRKRYVELNENGAKMEPKSEPEIVNISKNTRKMHPQNDTK